MGGLYAMSPDWSTGSIQLDDRSISTATRASLGSPLVLKPANAVHRTRIHNNVKNSIVIFCLPVGVAGYCNVFIVSSFRIQS